jgi:hypothetical protein
VVMKYVQVFRCRDFLTRQLILMGVCLRFTDIEDGRRRRSRSARRLRLNRGAKIGGGGDMRCAV